MKEVLTVLLLMFTLAGTSQDLDCKKFKTGFFQNIDSKDGNTYIKRTNEYQFETDTSTGEEIKLKVTWINDCSYRLSLIEGNSEWEEGKHIPNNPDLIVEIIETGEDYYIQVSRFEGMDDFEYRSKMKLVKQ